MKNIGLESARPPLARRIGVHFRGLVEALSPFSPTAQRVFIKLGQMNRNALQGKETAGRMLGSLEVSTFPSKAFSLSHTHPLP